MTTIDHRILIPAAPDVVWNYVSDITHNPDWQIDCSEVIFLTSRREGPGVRWRYASPNGHERVVAVSAWYNGLGYEYYFVDGMPFRENKGRIRLQEIPEGTIVQWTFTYELGGLFGGMRNALGISREVDHTIADSLKTLWQKIKASGGAARTYEPKSLMRDAPDVEARSNYQPRHPSATGSERSETDEAKTEKPKPRIVLEPPIEEDDGQPISVIAASAAPIIDEPPIEEEDTRPRVAAARTEAESVPADLESEPEFLEELVDLSRFEPPRDPTDTQPKRPLEAEPAAEVRPEPVIPKGEETEPLAFTPPETLPDLFAPPAAPNLDEAPLVDEDAPDVSEPDFPLTQALFERNVEAHPAPEARDVDEAFAVQGVGEPPPPIESATVPVIDAEQPTVETIAPPAPPEQEAEGEAASIWDVFGVPRPSETQQTEPVSADAASETAPEEPVVVERIARTNGNMISARAGLRIVLRRKLARVRRP